MPSDRVGDGQIRGHGGSRNSGEVELASGDGMVREVKGMRLGKLRGIVGNRFRGLAHAKEVRKRVFHGELELPLMAGVGVSGGVKNGTTGSL